MGYILITAVYLVTLIVGYIFLRRKYKKVDMNELNAMLTCILEESLKNKSLSKASQSIAFILQRYYKIDYVTIFIRDSHDWLSVIASNVGSGFLKSLELYCNSLIKKASNWDSKISASEGGSLVYNSASDRGICFSNFTPLVIKDKLIGGVLLEHRNASEMLDARFDLYTKLFNSTALVLQNLIYTEELVSAVSTDQLTGVYNRRFIDVTLVEQIEQHSSLGLQFNIALLDIDHFKKFNDTYGHQFGDLVLQEVSNYIKSQLGENSWISRYGGEEFLIFIGRSNTSNVYKKIDSIREGISKLALTDGKQTASVTASFGVSCYPMHGKTAEELIANADTALYQSKENGRNKVTVYREGK